MVKAFFRAPTSIIGLILLALLAVDAIVAPVLLADRARAFDVFAANQRPSSAHWFGTDALGRDLLMRTLVAAPVSLSLALVATVLSALIGYSLGTIAALLPGRPRTVVLRTIDALFAFPFLLVAIFMAAVIGPGVLGVVLGVAIPASFGKARVSSALVMSMGGREFISAARTLGVRPRRLMFRYLLPNIGETLTLTTAVSISAAILAVSSLSFLGLGIQPPDYDLGRMLTDGVNALYTNPMAALGPALLIGMCALAFGFVGEALARAFNPVLWTQTQPSSRTRTAAAPERPVVIAATSSDALRDATPVPPPPESSPPILEVANLSVTFPGAVAPVQVLDDVSFSVARGETLGIVGESGSGKTMTTLAIAQLVPHPGHVAGTVRIDGNDLGKMPRRALRTLLGTRVANVFQDPGASLNPSLKIGVQLTEGVTEHRRMSQRQAAAAALDALKEVNIAAPERQLGRHPHELSGGMRQRVMIAMGVMKQPDVLIADEPTTALDVTVQAQIMELLSEINSRRHTAVLFVSHNIALVSQNCERALVMYAGRIVEDLSMAQMEANPLHPYTRALLGAVPDMSRPRTDRLETIPGVAPDPSDLPDGCAFRPRCPLAVAACATERPALLQRPDGRRVACLVVNSDLA
ncbi:MAG: dipeptide/oligopeptide/nickel ABC transporter permease/ATP-binding protein [Chloroflexi bacterium]|nr:dipeptide/oligopeptide/nickel ABC transporter permease/ATP-binding protein [Chloroflexota bacterium]